MSNAYIAVNPGICISTLYNKVHSFHYVNKEINFDCIDKFKYIKTFCAIINNNDLFEIGQWSGIFSYLGYKYEIIENNTWKKYFGLWPSNEEQAVKHWIKVAKYRYPMLPVKNDNYEPILAACYLHDRSVNESVGGFV